MVPKPGEVYWAKELEGEQRHRYIIVSHQAFNQGKYVTVVPTTSHRFHERAKYRSCVAFNKNAFQCFSEQCVAQAEAISHVLKSDLQLGSGPIGTLSKEKMGELIGAIGYAIGAICEPQPD